MTKWSKMWLQGELSPRDENREIFEVRNLTYRGDFGSTLKRAKWSFLLILALFGGNLAGSRCLVF